MTDWFDVNVGLCQGCPPSPLLFNCFINDLALKIKAVGKGVSIDNDVRVCIRMYADEIVLIGENERDLQNMLNELSVWCEANHMQTNSTKIKWFITDTSLFHVLPLILVAFLLI